MARDLITTTSTGPTNSAMPIGIDLMRLQYLHSAVTRLLLAPVAAYCQQQSTSRKQQRRRFCITLFAHIFSLKLKRYKYLTLVFVSCIVIQRANVFPVTGPVVVQMVGRVIALLFHDLGASRRLVVSVTSRPLLTPGKDPVPIVQEAGWATGPVWTGAENLAPPTEIRSLDRPARSAVAIPTALPGPRIFYKMIVKLYYVRILEVRIWLMQ